MFLFTHTPVSVRDRLVARLRLWARLWHRYETGAHLDASGVQARRRIEREA